MAEYKEEKETIFWKKDRKGIKCKICHFECNIPNGSFGICGVRQNKENELIIKNYGEADGIEVNRIELRNFYNFLPNTLTLAVKMKAPKNFQILPDVKKVNKKLKPVELVAYAKKNGVKSIIFTGSEFVGHYEYVIKVFREAKRNNIYTILATSCLINEDPIKKISKYTDALAIYFFASGNEDYYKKNTLIKDVRRVFDVIKEFFKYRIFIEISNILVNGYESLEDFKKLANWIVANLGAEIPFHILKGNAKLSLIQLKEYHTVCKDAGLRYAYVDNSKDSLMESTYCHNCGNILVERSGSKVKSINLAGDRCPNCGIRHNFIFE
jgi:pyruvate formate lyase activating enzyme